MIRNTLVCILAVLALGKGVLCSKSTVVTSTVIASSPSAGKSSSAAKSLPAVLSSPSAVSSSFVVASSSPSAVTSSPSAVASSSPSVVASSSPSAVASSSPSAVPSSSPSAVPSASPSVVPSLSPSAVTSSPSASASSFSGSVVTKTASPSATPSLSSTVMTSSQVPSSSPVLPITTSAVSFITPSRTAVVASETIHIDDMSGEPCLAATLEVDFVIHYTTKQNTTITTTIPLNGYNDKTIGDCSIENGSAFFQIYWNEEGLSKPKHTFKMTFQRNSTNGSWTVPQVYAMFQTTGDSRFHHPVNSNITASSDGSKFGKNKANYICDAQVKLQMSVNVIAMFKQVVLQPFSRNSTINHEGPHCAADSGNSDDDDDDNTVPIAVGAALGGLVLIVLVAYIIGRRRSNRGYEQV